jgi:hypothetical protein
MLLSQAPISKFAPYLSSIRRTVWRPAKDVQSTSGTFNQTLVHRRDAQARSPQKASTDDRQRTIATTEISDAM